MIKELGDGHDEGAVKYNQGYQGNHTHQGSDNIDADN